MLASPIHKFQTIVTQNPNVHLKRKKRRRKRKKSNIITNVETDFLSSRAAANKVLKRKILNKTKQYYQHDNRLGMKTNPRRVPFTSSEMCGTYDENSIEREIHYNEVAKKFKPIHNITQNKNSIKPKKAFSKNHSRKGLKTDHKKPLKQKLPLMGDERDRKNNSTTNPTTTLALMQPQICLCSCRNEQKKYNVSSCNRSDNFGLQTAVYGNVSNKLSAPTSNASSDTTASLVKCSEKLATINNGFTKILEHLQNQVPTLLFGNILDNTNNELFENFDKSSRIRDSDHLAKGQQEKSPKLRQKLNVSECFVDGSTLNLYHKGREDIAKNLALQIKLDTKREEMAAVATKETTKRHAMVRTPSMEHVLSDDNAAVAADKNYSPLKKKRKKKNRERSPSPERRKDKKKKSKKSKKESKPKKSKKERKRKDSESETIADNDKESIDQDSESDIAAEVKKIQKKPKKDKKKRRYKRKELSSSSDEARSISPTIKVVKSKSKKSEAVRENTYYNYRSRSRSKERSTKPKSSQRHRYNHPRRSSSQNNRRKSRSYSHSNKDSSTRRDEMRETKNVNAGYLSRSRDHYSRDRSAASYNKSDREGRASRSPLKSEHENEEEKAKSLKRKDIDKYLHRKGRSPSTDKRKRYSPSHSSTISRKSCEKIAATVGAAIERNLVKRRSRTPNQKRSDNQSKLNKSRSRSSSVPNKSLSPLPHTSKIIETTKYEKKIKNQKKCGAANRNDKKSRSRSISMSSHTTSPTAISKSRTPSPKMEHLDEQFVPKSLHTQKLREQNIYSPSTMRTPTPQQGRSRYVINEKRRKEKKFSSSSKEWVECTKEKTEQTSRTPPPKTDKKPLSLRSSRDSSELSYSPARRNPERYRDILEITKHEKCKVDENDVDKRELEWERKEKAAKNERNQAKPVVRLQSQSDDESDATERNTEKLLDEFQELQHNSELSDLKMLEHLKTGLAAKAKEKIKTIEKMAASGSSKMSINSEGEVVEKQFKRVVRNSLNDFLTANNVAPAVVATCSPTTYNGKANSPPGAIYPQTLEEIKKEQESVLQISENFSSVENNKASEKGQETQLESKKYLLTANDHVPNSSPTTASFWNKERDRKRDLHERERESHSFYKDRYLERRQKSMSTFYSAGGVGLGGVNAGGGNISGGRRNSNNTMLNISHRQRLNIMCNTGGVGIHHHPHAHLHPHHHHPNHKIINNHHSSATTSFFLANNPSANPHNLLCNHSNNSTNISFNRPSRINNTPLITATQFNNQMLSKQSNSILVNRRDHRTALSLGLSGTPCTNFSNSNLLLTKANTNSHHLHVAPVGHAVGSGYHHHHHHHHHHGQNTGVTSGGSNPTQITDRILMAASLVAAQRHSLGVHSTVSNAAAVAAANNLSFLHQQSKPKLLIKPFKINDSQPLVAALADSSLVDAIVSKVSTATVAAAESAARRSRSRSRRSRSRKRHDEKSSGASNSGGGGERDGNRRRSISRSRSSRSSSSSRSRGRSHSHRSSQSRTSQSSSSSHTSSQSSTSSSFGSSRSGTRSPSIPRRRGSPSFLDRRRITSARKRPIPYHRKVSSDVSSCYCSSCCSRESSLHSRSPSQDSRSPSRFLET